MCVVKEDKKYYIFFLDQDKEKKYIYEIQKKLCKNLQEFIDWKNHLEEKYWYSEKHHKQFHNLWEKNLNEIQTNNDDWGNDTS